jgi:hypothetical protein
VRIELTFQVAIFIIIRLLQEVREKGFQGFIPLTPLQRGKYRKREK